MFGSLSSARRLVAVSRAVRPLSKKKLPAAAAGAGEGGEAKKGKYKWWRDPLRNAGDEGKKFRLLVGAVVERLPQVTPEPTESAKRMDEVADRIAARRLIMRPLMPASMVDSDLTIAGPTSAASAAAMSDERVAFNKPPLPRVTEDDKANNRRSTNRRLDRRLFLLVKQGRELNPWTFPTGPVNLDKSETLRAAAERELAEDTGLKNSRETGVYFYGNAPSGHTKTYLEAAGPDGCDAVKVFFFPAMYLSGAPRLDGKELVDFVWAAKDELPEYLQGDQLAIANSMLMD